MSSSSSFSNTPSLSRPRQGRPKLPLVSCPHCRVTMFELTSRRPESKGKIFYRCMARDQFGVQCKLFKWQGEYAIWLIQSGIFESASGELAVVLLALNQLKEATNKLKTTMATIKDEVNSMKTDSVFLSKQLEVIKSMQQ
ncbi:hypothetical protein QOZ80_7AG0566470 [Eleusine coracana subsp. coracana]|nr:hypothetical protein QOZ80_7AG0566470 [Eleusine coracana subsp. coracana]